jgi:hypothetical protein
VVVEEDSEPRPLPKGKTREETHEEKEESEEEAFDIDELVILLHC